MSPAGGGPGPGTEAGTGAGPRRPGPGPAGGRDGIAVTGVGLVTPAGTGTSATWLGVCEGRSPAAHDPLLEGLPVDFSCRVTDFTPSGAAGCGPRWRTDRFVQFAQAAAAEALHDAGCAPADRDPARTGVVVGCGMGSLAVYDRAVERLGERGVQGVPPMTVPMMLPNMPAGEVALAQGARGPALGVTTACASGSSALAVARDWLASGTCDVVLAGGTESTLTRAAVTGFHRLGALSTRRDAPGEASRPFDRGRDGFVMAEGAAMLVLERARDAAARGVRPRARLLGAASTCDAHHPTAPHPEGAGAEAALRLALRDAGVTPEAVEHINAHGTSTPLNDSAEATVLARVFRHRPPVTSVKGALGHSLGAAGAIEAALTVLSLQQQRIPPTANLTAQDPALDLDVVHKTPRDQRMEIALSNSFGFGGHNAVLVFGRA